MAAASTPPPSGQPSVSRRRLPSADRRQQILDASLDLFVARGFEAVSMADVAFRLGVSRPTVYSYFGATEALLDALLSQRLRALWERLSPLLPADPGEPLDFAGLFRFLLGERETLSLLHSGGGPGFHSRRRAFLKELGERLDAQRAPAPARTPSLLLLLTALLDALAFSALDPEVDARALSATLAVFLQGGLRQLLETPPADPP